MDMPTQTYVFRARVERVVDGDTIDVQLDCGMHGYRTERLRLLDINAPERKLRTMEAGNKARSFVCEWVDAATVAAKDVRWPIVVQTEESDVFGRYLAYVWNAATRRCLNDDLLASGNAVVWTP